MAVSSIAVKKILKVSDCKLSHLRLAGNLPYSKKGNSYLYDANGIEMMKKKLLQDNA